MKSKKLDGGTVLIFETGDEVVSTLTAFAKEHHIAAAHFTAIGAFSDAGTWVFRLAEEGLPQESRSTNRSKWSLSSATSL